MYCSLYRKNRRVWGSDSPDIWTTIDGLLNWTGSVIVQILLLVENIGVKLVKAYQIDYCTDNCTYHFKDIRFG